MAEYTIKYMRPLGEFDDKYGQKYWGKVKEADPDVSFNMLRAVNFEEGDTISYEEKLIKETKGGKEYLQLRKVRVLSGEGTQIPLPGPKAPVEGGKKSDDYEPGTNARWAIGMAYRGHMQMTNTTPASDDTDTWSEIYGNAQRLVQMFSKVKAIASGEATAPLDRDNVATPTLNEPEEEPDATDAGLSGLDKARATAKKLKERSDKPELKKVTLTAEQAEAFLAKLGEEEQEDADER